MTKESKPYRCNPPAGAEWAEVATFPRKISRVVVNSRGTRIAVVADER